MDDKSDQTPPPQQGGNGEKDQPKQQTEQDNRELEDEKSKHRAIISLAPAVGPGTPKVAAATKKTAAAAEGDQKTSAANAEKNPEAKKEERQAKSSTGISLTPATDGESSGEVATTKTEASGADGLKKNGSSGNKEAEADGDAPATSSLNEYARNLASAEEEHRKQKDMADPSRKTSESSSNNEALAESSSSLKEYARNLATVEEEHRKDKGMADPSRASEPTSSNVARLPEASLLATSPGASNNNSSSGELKAEMLLLSSGSMMKRIRREDKNNLIGNAAPPPVTAVSPVTVVTSSPRSQITLAPGFEGEVPPPPKENGRPSIEEQDQEAKRAAAADSTYDHDVEAPLITTATVAPGAQRIRRIASSNDPSAYRVDSRISHTSFGTKDDSTAVADPNLPLAAELSRRNTELLLDHEAIRARHFEEFLDQQERTAVRATDIVELKDEEESGSRSRKNMIMILLALVGIAVVVGIAVAMGGKGDDKKEEDEMIASSSPGPSPPATTFAPSEEEGTDTETGEDLKTVWEILLDQSERFSTLISWAELTGHDFIYKNGDPESGKVTLFAPTDEAFAAVEPPGLLDKYFDVDLWGTEYLKFFLGFHDVGYTLNSTDIVNGTVLTWRRQFLTDSFIVTLPPPQVVSPTMPNPANVEEEYIASNGVVHVVDQVFTPIATRVNVYAAEQTGLFKILIELGDLCGLRTLFSSPGPKTFLAIPDQVFMAYGEEFINGLYNDLEGTRALFLNHLVLDRIVTLNEISSGMTFQSAAGFDLKGLAGTINGAPITPGLSDIHVNNGLVHIMMDLIFPPQA